MKAIHIDGRPCAWFERKCNDAVERVTYRSFAWAGDDPAALVRHAHGTVAKIEEMSRLNGKGEVPVVFWRRCMECTQEDDGSWKASFRIAVVPQLADEQWASLDPYCEGSQVKVLSAKPVHQGAEAAVK